MRLLLVLGVALASPLAFSEGRGVASSEVRQPADDKDKLNGSWRVVATEVDGQAVAEEVLKDREIVFQDGQFKVLVAGATRRTLKFKLDAKAQPRQIDLTNPDKAETALGIYSFGKDELTLCYGEPGAARPGEFASPPGKRIYLIRLKRGKQP